MRSYRDTMEDLRFSPEEKAAMTQALLQAAASAPAKTKRRKKAALIAVAAVTAALCAACATGYCRMPWPPCPPALAPRRRRWKSFRNSPTR